MCITQYFPVINSDNRLRLIACYVVYFADAENVEINFGAAPTGNMQCQASPQCMEEENICGWTGMTITSRVEKTFRVRIGPSGGLRGYEYITGNNTYMINIVAITQK